MTDPRLDGLSGGQTRAQHLAEVGVIEGHLIILRCPVLRQPIPCVARARDKIVPEPTWRHLIEGPPHGIDVNPDFRALRDGFHEARRHAAVQGMFAHWIYCNEQVYSTVSESL